MGCDIHMVVEVKDDAGLWRLIRSPAKPADEPYDPWPGWWGPGMNDRFADTWYANRNYEVFAVLAGVRNYIDAEPIAKPRGFPKDASVDLAINPDLLGDHSFSWLRLDEIQGFDWSAKVPTPRVLEDSDYHTFRGCCGDFLAFVERFLVPLHADPTRVRIVFGFDS